MAIIFCYECNVILTNMLRIGDILEFNPKWRIQNVSLRPPKGNGKMHISLYCD